MRTLKTLWLWWKRFGQVIGDIFARVVLTLFYFTIYMPFGVGVRLLADPLTIRGAHPICWFERTIAGATIENARRLS